MTAVYYYSTVVNDMAVSILPSKLIITSWNSNLKRRFIEIRFNFMSIPLNDMSSSWEKLHTAMKNSFNIDISPLTDNLQVILEVDKDMYKQIRSSISNIPFQTQWSDYTGY